MATFRKRGDRWQVQIRRTGQPNLSKSFVSKADAQRWARQMEAELDTKLLPHDFRRLETTTLADILLRYRNEIIPTKRGKDIETIIIDAFLRAPLATLKLSHLGSQDFAKYRDLRLEQVRPATVLRELGIVQHALDIASKEWGYPLSSNPVKGIRKPKLGASRERRVHPKEIATLLGGAKRSRNRHLAPAITLAIETGMRRGELLAMRWENLDLKQGILLIPRTKNGYPRRIPLTAKALEILKSQLNLGEERPLPITEESLKKSWQRLLKRVGIEDLRFHDLRHEAVSRFFELGLSMPEVALISGHRDPRMLFRYTHLDPKKVGEKLAARIVN